MKREEKYKVQEEITENNTIQMNEIRLDHNRD